MKPIIPPELLMSVDRSELALREHREFVDYLQHITQEGYQHHSSQIIRGYLYAFWDADMDAIDKFDRALRAAWPPEP